MYTKEYRKGYLAGIKRVLNMIENLEDDGVFHLRLGKDASYFSTFVTFEHVVNPIKDLYDGLSKSDK